MKHFLSLLFVAFLCNACYAQNKIEMNLRKGQVYNQKMSMIMGIKQKVYDIEMVIDMTFNVNTAFHVTDIKDGAYLMDVTYKSLSMKTDIPGQKSIAYDSESPGDTNSMSALLGELKNKSFQMKMNRQGKVLEVSNTANLYNSMFDKVPNMTETQKQQFRAQIEQSFGEKTFRSNMENMMAFYPSSPVSVGSTWPVNYKMFSANMDLQLSGSYKLDEVTADQYVLSGVSKMASPAGVVSDMKGVKVTVDINGEVSSNLKINKKTGWIDESFSNMGLKGNVAIAPSEKLPSGMNVPMEISGKVTVNAY